MALLDLTFDVPGVIAEGLANGSLERVGGVVREMATKRVVMWLREFSLDPTVVPGGVFNPLMTNLNPATGVFNLAMQGVNAGLSLKGFAAVNQRLDTIQGVLTLTSAASILNLGVSVMGFAVIAQRLKGLEQRLQKAQEILQKIDHKIDLSFYANFRAALDLASNAFTMTKGENRRNSALNAINRFLEAEHIYTDFVDKELELKSQISDEYLLTLYLAYIAEARCYLELEEFETATRRFREGSAQVRLRVEKYVDLLLTSCPLMYLHPALKEKTDLSRLTKIYQWKNPELDENSAFELMRNEFISNDNQFNKWIESLPASVIEKSKFKKDFWGIKQETRDEVIQRLPQMLEDMESMVESDRRFEAYEIEVKTIAKLGISFHEWLQLKPAEPQPEGATLMCIVPAEPLEL
ncbi:MAG: hypothetical protein HC890_15675 [Chloroflexaceae bacterium]|nr:hypothetical protein [Chloroflexaceae bacterium]